MKRTFAFRATPEITARIERMAAKRGVVPSLLIRQLVELGLDHFENERYVDAVRVAALMESTQAIVDRIGSHLIPDEMEEIPDIVIARMETYHIPT